MTSTIQMPVGSDDLTALQALRWLIELEMRETQYKVDQYLSASDDGEVPDRVWLTSVGEASGKSTAAAWSVGLTKVEPLAASGHRSLRGVSMIAGVRAYAIGSGMAWREQHFEVAVKCVAATDPADPAWKRKDAAVVMFRDQTGEPARESRALVRPVANWMLTHDRDPVSFWEVFPGANIKRPQTNLALTTAKQAVRDVDLDTGKYRMKILCPTIAIPQRFEDWAWFSFESNVPRHALERARTEHARTGIAPSKIFALPRVMVTDAETGRDAHGVYTAAVSGALWFDVTMFEHPTSSGNPDIALGADWNIRERSAGYDLAAIELDPDTGNYTYLGAWSYRCDGLLQKAHRLREESQELATKIAALKPYLFDRDANPRPNAQPSTLAAYSQLVIEKQRVNDKRTRIHTDLGKRVAHVIADLATATGAGLVGLEDLASLEPGIGRRNNTLITESCKRVVADYAQHHLATKGIKAREVPARGTSQGCPRCGNTVGTHADYDIMHCPKCKLRLPRDTSSGQKIALRAHRGHRGKGNVTAAKGRPTPKQVRGRSTTRTLAWHKPRPARLAHNQLPTRNQSRAGRRPSLTSTLRPTTESATPTPQRGRIEATSGNSSPRHPEAINR